MTAPSTQQLRQVITSWMSENSFVQDGDASSLPDDLDLVEAGWLDSMAIIELRRASVTASISSWPMSGRTCGIMR